MDLQSKLRFLIPPHPLTNSEILLYYQNETRFDGVYSRDNLLDKVKDGAYIINRVEYSDIETHSIALYALIHNTTYFGSFRVEHIPKEVKIFIDQSIVIENVFSIQVYDSIMCGYFCIRFIDFIFAGKTLTNFSFKVFDD